jgi:hypothetical protein
MLIVALALIFCASGCTGPTPGDANRAAREFCSTHGGVENVEFFDGGGWPYQNGYDVYCNDGSEIE